MCSDHPTCEGIYTCRIGIGMAEARHIRGFVIVYFWGGTLFVEVQKVQLHIQLSPANQVLEIFKTWGSDQNFQFGKGNFRQI